MPLVINGSSIDLSHLIPIYRKVNLELRGNLIKEVDVLFEFSCHCYSRSQKTGEVVSKETLVQDGSVHSPRLRIFDRDRYKLSKQLVELLDLLIESNGQVSKTHRDNFFRTEVLSTDLKMKRRPISYFIFMHARVVSSFHKAKYMRVFVESAYPEQEGKSYPVKKVTRSFGNMLGEKWAP